GRIGAMSGAAAASPLPGNLRGNRRLSQWLRFRADGFVEIFSGKVEIGQGILTALAQIAAEALDVSVASVRMIPASTATSPAKAANAHRIVGQAIARLDLPDKVFGEPCFIHDLELPQMLHGRVLRPPSPDATLIDIDESQVRTLPGVVAIVRDGSLVGVLAET